MSNLHSRYAFCQNANGIISVSIPIPSLHTSKQLTVKSKIDNPSMVDVKCQSSTYKVMETSSHVFFRCENPLHEFRFRSSIESFREIDTESNKHLRNSYCKKGINKKSLTNIHNMIKTIDDHIE